MYDFEMFHYDYVLAIKLEELKIKATKTVRVEIPRSHIINVTRH